MKELTYEEWQKNPMPRMMWVWNDDFKKREKSKVVYVIKDDFVSYPVVAVSEEEASFCIYRHCAEIEEPKTRKMKDIDTSRYTITESGNVIRSICGGRGRGRNHTRNSSRRTRKRTPISRNDNAEL